jgi:hypothetical protein
MSMVPVESEQKEVEKEACSRRASGSGYGIGRSLPRVSIGSSSAREQDKWKIYGQRPILSEECHSPEREVQVLRHVYKCPQHDQLCSIRNIYWQWLPALISLILFHSLVKSTDAYFLRPPSS